MLSFTQDEYEKAKQVKLIDYLISNGYNLKKVGTNEYTLKEHDSMRINDLKNTFYWNSRNVGGSTIQFLQYYEGKTFVEAIKTLNSKNILSHNNLNKNIIEKEKVILPEKNVNNKRLIAYLTQTRKIDAEIVYDLIKKGVIYEDKENHNIVFIGKDNNNNVKYASKRSTLTNSNYKGDCKNSDKNFGFRIHSKNNCNKVFVFESAIDLMTHATISKDLGKDWENINRVSLGCLSFKAIDNFLEDNKNIEEIVLFLDNDKAGKENANKFYNNYSNNYKIYIICVKNKDLNQSWQDYLKDKELDNTLKFSSYITYLNKPFLPPKILENSENLKKYLKNILQDVKFENIESIFNNKMIFETENNKVILFAKDEKGKNIGGYEWDIYNKDFNIKLLENSKEQPIYFNNISEEENDCLFIYNDIVSPIYFLNSVNTAYVNNMDNLTNIDKLIKHNNRIKEIYLFVDERTDFYKQFKNENSVLYKNISLKASKYNIKIGIESWDKSTFKEFLKKDFFNKSLFLPKEGNSEELYCFLRKNTNINKEILLKLFKDNHIYQDVDRNMVFLVKNKDSENIGGYGWDIYNKKSQIIRLPNSNIDKETEEKILKFIKDIYKNIHNEQEKQQDEEMER